MRLQLMILGAVIGTFGLAGLAPATASGGGSSGGHGGGAGGSGGGGGAHAGAAHGGGFAHGVAVHGGATAREGDGHATSVRLGSGQSALAKAGFVEERTETIDGHHATVAVFHRPPLTSSEKETLRRYHFKGFDNCAVHQGACQNEASRGGVEIYCRRILNVAFSKDLDCLSFNGSG